jgi:hypothetical protein
MKALKRKKLEDAGWKVGSASEFLELSDVEAMLIEMKLSLAMKIKELRQKANVKTSWRIALAPVNRVLQN